RQGDPPRRYRSSPADRPVGAAPAARVRATTMGPCAARDPCRRRARLPAPRRQPPARRQTTKRDAWLPRNDGTLIRSLLSTTFWITPEEPRLALPAHDATHLVDGNLNLNAAVAALPATRLRVPWRPRPPPPVPWAPATLGAARPQGVVAATAHSAAAAAPGRAAASAPPPAIRRERAPGSGAARDARPIAPAHRRRLAAAKAKRRPGRASQVC